MSTMLFCDHCQKVHAFPRDMAQQQERPSRLMLAVAVIAQFLGMLIAVAVIGVTFVWLVTR